MTERETASAAPDRTSSRILAVIFSVIESLVLLAILASAWKARSVWPVVPIADPDTWGYLRPVLTWLSGLGFQQTDGRDWLYPAFLALFLKTSGSFAGIAVWQRLLGLLSGVLMAITWRSWVSLLPFNRWVQFLVSLSGALPIFVQLVNQQNILFEVSIRPEAVLSFFVYAQLACLVGYCKYRWQSPRPLPSLCLGAAAIVLAYACLVLKPSWFLACATTSVPIFAGLFGHALTLRTRLLTPVVGMVLALLVLWFPAKKLVIHDTASRTLLPDALFCVHAQLIDKLLAARLSALPDSDPEKARLQALVNVIESELHTAANDPRAYELLGINADYLMHSTTFSNAIHAYAGGGREEFRNFCFACFRDAIIHYPLDYAKKVHSQFTHFLFIDRESFSRDNTNLPHLYKEAADVLQPEMAAGLRPDLQEMYRRYLGDLAVQIGSAKALGKDPKLRVLRKDFARWALPVEILFLLTLLATLAWLPLRDLHLSGWVPFFLFLAPFGNAFGVCLVHTLDITRYRATIGGFLLFALTAMAVFVLMVLVRSLLHAAGKWTRPKIGG